MLSCRLLTALVVAAPSMAAAQQQQVQVQPDGTFGGNCWSPQPSPTNIKTIYVGVLAIRGVEAAYEGFNGTFSDYLTATAGQRFSQPVQFVMRPLNFSSMFTDTQDASIDFLYANPSAFSCMESEFQALSLVSQISRRNVNGVTYDLDKFGGVILVRSNRDDLNSIYDLKGQIIAAASISGLGSGQMQFREMVQAGLYYINDPKQVVFTSNQGKVIQGVLNGDFDVGFVRTDQLERTLDSDGVPLDRSLFKILNTKANLDPGFPFESSTPLYPEWNLAALPHVPSEITREVQNAMLAVSEHGAVGQARAACKDAFNETYCNTETIFVNSTVLRCDTTLEIADVAYRAMIAGGYSGWTTTRSYMELRSMQQSTGFIELEPTTNIWRCTRSSEIYNSITCPVNFGKKSRQQVETACADAGLTCSEEFQCVCQPCYEIKQCEQEVNIFGRCVAYPTLLAWILVPLIVIFVILFASVIAHKSKQLVKQADRSAQNERQINEYLAHEIRNPLSAAISASTFVQSVIHGDKPIENEARAVVSEDVGIIDTSLRFINELLRSILDANRATHNQMVLDVSTADILHDIFEPVASMIYTRDTNFKVQIECAENLEVETDRLRLHQVVLNLARNAAKFVEEGFIRLRAEATEKNVQIYVEDSGPGIPESKRDRLFLSKYQESLDRVAQGTGIGLSLCKDIVDLMKGDIFLDETYTSGYKLNRGTRIVISLNKRPIKTTPESRSIECIPPTSSLEMAKLTPILPPPPSQTFPDNLSVLFVDDDRILRKQGSRAISRVAPDWIVREAASGEIAIELAKKDAFDIIFMDMYMTSVGQSLTGTETIRALRNLGVASTICGLSANNLEDVFKESGAEFFHLKPFPCRPEELKELLKDLLSSKSEDTMRPVGAHVALTADTISTGHDMSSSDNHC